MMMMMFFLWKQEWALNVENISVVDDAVPSKKNKNQLKIGHEWARECRGERRRKISLKNIDSIVCLEMLTNLCHGKSERSVRDGMMMALKNRSDEEVMKTSWEERIIDTRCVHYRTRSCLKNDIDVHTTNKHHTDLKLTQRVFKSPGSLDWAAESLILVQLAFLFSFFCFKLNSQLIAQYHHLSLLNSPRMRSFFSHRRHCRKVC